MQWPQVTVTCGPAEEKVPDAFGTPIGTTGSIYTDATGQFMLLNGIKYRWNVHSDGDGLTCGWEKVTE